MLGRNYEPLKYIYVSLFFKESELTVLFLVIETKILCSNNRPIETPKKKNVFFKNVITQFKTKLKVSIYTMVAVS